MKQGKLSPWLIEANNIKLGFIDSSDYFLDLDDLKYVLESKARFVFVHHPVMLGSSQFMDKNHSLKNIEEVQHFFAEYVSVESKTVFFHGHYHCDAVISGKKVTSYICPSTYYAIDTSELAHVVEHAQPGFRLIEIDNQLNIVTKSIYKGTIA